MKCPSCKGSTLRLVKLQDQLPARKCLECGGVLVDLLSYRAWAENHAAADAAGPTAEEARDNARALMCPSCSRIMLKYRICGDRPNRVDVCTLCDHAWLDEGEWELLGALTLQRKLTTLFTEPWQRRVRDEESRIAQAARLRALLGDQDYERLMEIKTWLDAHPRRQELIRMLLKR